MINNTSTAYELGMSTFKKTGFMNNAFFLSRCLRSNVTQMGFRLKLHSNNLSRKLKKHFLTCSRNLIRITLRHNDTAQVCSDKLPLLANRLRNLCTNFEDFLSIRQKIHELNQLIYDALKQTKKRNSKNLYLQSMVMITK